MLLEGFFLTSYKGIGYIVSTLNPSVNKIVNGNEIYGASF